MEDGIRRLQFVAGRGLACLPLDLMPARAGLTEKRTWSTKFEMRSPRNTTQVTELPTAHA